MKKGIFYSPLLLLLAAAGILQECCAAAGYEFLTPKAVVLKSDKAPKGPFQAKENGLLRDEKGNITRKADITFYKYLTFAKPFSPGEKRQIGPFLLHYDPAIPSSVFKVNQVGYAVSQKKKFAYLGAWLGNAGALPLKHLAGKNFELRRSSDGRCVFKNTLQLRREDPLYKGKTPFTGEEVLEADFSSFSRPGTYFLFVDGIGRSMDFSISAEALSEAFYIHARGLYHKRCGIAKKAPFTAWEAPACHSEVLRGRFPGRDEHYRKGKEEKSFGFFDRKGNRMAVRHFELIKENPPYKELRVTAPGGWHDAADYDRRPYHLRIVSDLAMVYLMKPQNFIDGQLNLPESGNGIPDILDEAAWGVKHLLALQQSDGGVGTWIETTGHPGPGEGLPHKEKRTYYVSAPSRNGTLEYAAAVSTLALAVKKAGFPAEAEKYLDSAVRAWRFAMRIEHRLVSCFRLKNQLITYMEEPHLYGEYLLKAGVNLYILTGESQYLLPLTEKQEEILKDFNKDFWKWSRLTWMSLELFPVKELSQIRAQYRKRLLREADKMLADQENAYPYRTLWHAHDAGWVHTMGWGNYHPLRRAVTLIAAHKLTGEEKYLAGAWLANDFHNGANPLGRSMTSGLGKVYPVLFLDLISYTGRFKEFVPGITPYGNTFGIDKNAVKMVYGENADRLPIFRRHINLEFLSVPASEYSIWETIAPAAVTTGYLLEKPVQPPAELKNRKPAVDFRKLPGYRALP